jgi:predicted HAD superfamily Cof-like phosphohydrolase
MGVQEDVAEFHRVFRLTGRDSANRLNPEVVELRKKLLTDEVEELLVEIDENNPVGIAHETADVVYIAYGLAWTYGFDLDAVLAEVHRANMSKLDANGQPVFREDGKVLKSDQFVPADVASVLRKQMERDYR